MNREGIQFGRTRLEGRLTRSFLSLRMQAVRCLLAGTAAACLVLALHPACAADAPGVNPLELSPEELFGATVTSVSKTPSSVWDSPAAVTVLTQDDIHRSGATSIPEALRLVPGVDVARTNADGWAIGIRGFNGPLDNKLLVLIDGREVYDHLFSGVYWDIQDLPLEDIERIEVVRGPGATLWGANAVNGVINIITKDASETQGGLASAIAGNQEHFTGTGQYGGKIGDSGYYRVYGKFLDHGEEASLAGGSAEDGYQAWRGGFRSDWNLDVADKLTVQGDLYKSGESYLRDVANITAAPFFTRQLGSIEPDGGNLLARWTRNLAGDSQLQWLTYVDYTHRDDVLVLDDRRTSFDTEAQYDFPTMGKHKVITGLRFRYSHEDISPNTVTNVVLSAPPDHDEQLYSAFIQDQITLVPKTWTLTLGSKFEHNDFTGFEIEPSARLQWFPDPTHTLWTSVSRAVRTPSEVEEDLRLFTSTITLPPPNPFAGIPIAVTTVPSPNFDAEDVVAYEAGYRQRLTQDASLDIATFYNDYSKLETLSIDAPDFSNFPASITLPISFTNDTHGQTYGVETTLEWQARPDLKLVANHTFLKMTLEGPPAAQAAGAEVAEKQSPESQLNLQARWDVTDRFQWDNTLYHVSELSNFKVDGYWRADTRLGWKVNQGIEAELIGQNLFNAKHREFTAPADPSAAEIRRSVFARLTCRF